MRHFFTWMCLLSLLTGSVLAQDWYVDNTNPSCNNTGPGDFATPLCDITTANAVHAGGDTVYIMPGEYRESMYPKPGTPGAYTIYSGYGDRSQIIILGSDEVPSNTWTVYSGNIYVAPFNDTLMCWEDRIKWLNPSAGIPNMTQGTHYSSGGNIYVWTNDGSHPNTHQIECAVRDVATWVDAPWMTIRHHIEFFSLENVTVMQTQGRGIDLGGDAHNISIINNEVAYTIGATDSNAAGIGHGSVSYQPASEMHIIGNKIHDIGSNDGEKYDWSNNHYGTAITLYSSRNSVIKNNEIYNAVGGIQPKAGNENLTIEDNVFYDIGGAGIRSAYGLYNTTIANNKFYNMGNGIQLEGGTTNFTVANNVFWNVTYNDIYLSADLTRDTPPTINWVTLTNSIEDVYIFNNIFSGSVAISRTILNSNGDSVFILESENNLVHASSTFNDFGTFRDLTGWRSATSFDLLSFIDTPLFVDQANNDYDLQAGSPGIDNGTIVLGYHCTLPDVESEPGCRVWFGSAPDIGAYEYPANATPSCPLFYDVTNCGCINSSELASAINGWFDDTIGISILMQHIRTWKGCSS